MEVAYIDTEGGSYVGYALHAFDIPIQGTFRPDRIRAIADRFGVDGSTALENILYGGLVTIYF